MKVFVGLGNPGAKYKNNRHNIGFHAIDAIASKYDFPKWRSNFQSQIAQGFLSSEKVMLLKPQTYMNNSGQAVGAAMRYLKLSPQDIYVFHDELDLAPAKLKHKLGGGQAGHNGLRSIQQHIGAEFHRIRIGIGHPGSKDRVVGYVLGDFASTDQEWLADVMAGISSGAEALAKGEVARFLNKSMPQKPDKPPRAKKPKKEALPIANEDPPDLRTAFQKLADKFRIKS